MARKIYLLSPTAREGTVPLPMISFTLLAQTLDLHSYDLLLFTSKQAVKSAETLNPGWKEVPCLAIGSATAKQIVALGGTVVHQPDTFYVTSLGEDIIEHFQEKKIVYLRPKIVSFDTKTFLAKAGIEIDEKILYETSCHKYEKKKQPEKEAIIIFTSPSTIKCFFKNFTWDVSYTAVLIGTATQKHLPEYIDYIVADKATIESCIDKAKTFLLSSNSK